jgi:hypothetical protein
MKLKAEILSVETTGDTLQVRAQANELAAADWRSMVPVNFQIADTKRARDTMRVGRHLEIEIRPLP